MGLNLEVFLRADTSTDLRQIMRFREYLCKREESVGQIRVGARESDLKVLLVITASSEKTKYKY